MTCSRSLRASADFAFRGDGVTDYARFWPATLPSCSYVAVMGEWKGIVVRVVAKEKMWSIKEGILRREGDRATDRKKEANQMQHYGCDGI